MNKLGFLTKYSLGKKIKSKWFIVVNIIILVVISALINMYSIINIACMCNAEDYWTTGRNAQKLGFNSENIHLVENNVAKI